MNKLAEFPPQTEINTLDEEQLFSPEFVQEMNQRLGNVALAHQVEVNQAPSYASKIDVAIKANTANPIFKQPNVSAFKSEKDSKPREALPKNIETNDTAFADGYLDQMMAFKEQNFSDKFEVQAREEAKAQAMQEERDQHMMVELMDQERAAKIKAENKKRRNKKHVSYTDIS